MTSIVKHHRQNKEYKIQTYIHCSANVAQNVTYRIYALIKKKLADYGFVYRY